MYNEASTTRPTKATPPAVFLPGTTWKRFGSASKTTTLATRPSGSLIQRWSRAYKKAWEMRTHGATYNEIDRATCVFSSTNSYTCMFRNRTYLGIRKRGRSWDHHPRRVSNPFLTS